MSAGRFSKKNGAMFDPLEYANENSRSATIRQLRPDYYNPYRKPVRSPNLLTNRLEKTFGKRVVEATAESIARRAPLGMAGPLGDLLAAGLITWELYLLILELMRNGHPPGYGKPGDPDPGSWQPGDPVPVDTSTADISWNFPDGYFTSNGWTKISNHSTYQNDAWYFAMPGPIGIGSDFDPWMYPAFPLTPGIGSYTFTTTVYGRSPSDNFAKRSWAFQEGYSWDFATSGKTLSDIWIGPVGDPLTYPTDIPFDWTELDPNLKRELYPDGINESQRNPQPRPANKPNPKRPGKRTKERKVKTALGTMLKILDIVSEAAEFVGAFYDALPAETRRRWEEKYAGGHWVKIKGKYKWLIDSRGLLDNAGQYGIDGADWKARALWHNWHEVDMEQAIKNVIANEFQDKILGMYQRSLPKNIGHVADGGSMGLNELISNFTDTIGLT